MSMTGSTAADLPPIGDGAAGPGAGRSLEALLDVSLPVVIEIATGSVIEIDRAVGDPGDIYVGDRLFAQGEVVVVGEAFGVRVTRLLQSSGTESNS